MCMVKTVKICFLFSFRYSTVIDHAYAGVVTQDHGSAGYNN